MRECIFCEIAKTKDLPNKVWEDEGFIAFLSIFPNTKGVTVVIPKKHYSSYVFDLPEDVMCELMKAARKVAGILDRKFEDVGRTGLVFEGFGVDHIHAKLFPLHGTALKEWKQIGSAVDKYFKQYEGYISSHDYKRAEDAELFELAAWLRGDKGDY